MLEITLSLLFGAITGLVVIARENAKLRAKEKLKEIEVEDAKLETSQKFVIEQKLEVSKEFEALKSVSASELSDKEIESFWNDSSKDKK